MSFYVYELVDPRTGAVFYVGKGARRRIDFHEFEARSGRISRKCYRIRDIEAEGYRIGKRIVRQFTNEQDAYDFESDLIDQHGIENLTNVVRGGGTARALVKQVSDKDQVSATAEIVRLTSNGQITHVSVLGKMLHLAPILALYKSRVAEIIDRRGPAWVNAIAKRFEVEFSHGHQ